MPSRPVWPSLTSVNVGRVQSDTDRNDTAVDRHRLAYVYADVSPLALAVAPLHPLEYNDKLHVLSYNCPVSVARAGFVLTQRLDRLVVPLNPHSISFLVASRNNYTT